MVFNQVNFHDPRKYKARTGANLDLNKIRDIFSFFSFKVEIRVDLTAKEIFSVLHHCKYQGSRTLHNNLSILLTILSLVIRSVTKKNHIPHSCVTFSYERLLYFIIFDKLFGIAENDQLL